MDNDISITNEMQVISVKKETLDGVVEYLETVKSQYDVLKNREKKRQERAQRWKPDGSKKQDALTWLHARWSEQSQLLKLDERRWKLWRKEVAQGLKSAPFQPLAKVKPNDNKVFLQLCKSLSPDGTHINIKQETLAKRLHVSKRTISRAINRFCEAEMFNKERQRQKSNPGKLAHYHYIPGCWKPEKQGLPVDLPVDTVSSHIRSISYIEESSNYSKQSFPTDEGTEGTRREEESLSLEPSYPPTEDHSPYSLAKKEELSGEDEATWEDDFEALYPEYCTATRDNPETETPLSLPGKGDREDTPCIEITPSLGDGANSSMLHARQFLSRTTTHPTSSITCGTPTKMGLRRNINGGTSRDSSQNLSEEAICKKKNGGKSTTHAKKKSPHSENGMLSSITYVRELQQEMNTSLLCIGLRISRELRRSTCSPTSTYTTPTLKTVSSLEQGTKETPPCKTSTPNLKDGSIAMRESILSASSRSCTKDSPTNTGWHSEINSSYLPYSLPTKPEWTPTCLHQHTKAAIWMAPPFWTTPAKLTEDTIWNIPERSRTAINDGNAEKLQFNLISSRLVPTVAHIQPAGLTVSGQNLSPAPSCRGGENLSSYEPISAPESSGGRDDYTNLPKVPQIDVWEPWPPVWIPIEHDEYADFEGGE